MVGSSMFTLHNPKLSASRLHSHGDVRLLASERKREIERDEQMDEWSRWGVSFITVTRKRRCMKDDRTERQKGRENERWAEGQQRREWFKHILFICVEGGCEWVNWGSSKFTALWMWWKASWVCVRCVGFTCGWQQGWRQKAVCSVVEDSGAVLHTGPIGTLWWAAWTRAVEGVNRH